MVDDIPTPQPDPDDDAGKYARLAKRVVNRQVVPFLGAGFSYGAQHPEGWKSEPNRMSRQLKGCLTMLLGGSTTKKSAAKRTLEAINDPKERSLGRLAELETLIAGPISVCETLEIHKYADLRPLPSHRYLAYMIREGLIREVITTNYDCCLETAFRDSFFQKDLAEAQLGVVRTLEEYRDTADKHTLPGHLLLFKINGCAGAYSEGRKPEDWRAWESAAERIILTERQLQTFRHENWAKELFQDRARSRTLLFSGFGNEEPQIRHTALALMEEFSKDDDGMTWYMAMDLPNAPFFQEYCEFLRFYQVQILVQFLDYHSKDRMKEVTAEDHIKHIFCNVLLGESGGRLDPSGFAHQLFHLVFRCCLILEAQLDSVLAVWLRRCTLEFRAWLVDFVDLWPYTNGRAGVEDNLRNAFDHFIDSLLGGKNATEIPLPLWRFLFAMYYPGHGEQAGWYLSIREDGVSVGVTLLLLWFLKAEIVQESTIRVPSDSAKRDKPLELRLIHRPSLPDGGFAEFPDNGGRLVRLISVPSRSSNPVEGRLQMPVDEAGRVLRVGRWLVVSAEDLIKQSVRPENLRSTVCRAFGELRSEPNARLTKLSRTTSAHGNDWGNAP